jgi:hypothetical protein
VAVGGRLLVVGGRNSVATDPAVLVGTPSGGRLTWRRVGSLRVPTADPGAVAVGGAVVVVGGETPARSSAAQRLALSGG